MTTLCVWGKGGVQAKEVAFQQTGFPKQTKMKFSLKRPRDSLGPAFISLCNLIFVGLFDKSQSPRGQTLDLACSAGPAPGPMPAVWLVLICTVERGNASDIITESIQVDQELEPPES